MYIVERDIVNHNKALKFTTILEQNKNSNSLKTYLKHLQIGKLLF